MTTGEGHVLASGPAPEELEARLSTGADRLAAARTLLSHPRFLVGAAATLMTAGVTAVVLGWVGASNTTFVEEQVPYLISGGLLGVALAIVGALLFFTHWLTVAVKEARQHEAARRQDHEELVGAVRALGDALARGGDSDGDARGTRSGRSVRRAPRRS